MVSKGTGRCDKVSRLRMGWLSHFSGFQADRLSQAVQYLALWCLDSGLESESPVEDMGVWALGWLGYT